jgi:hypothetical protein
VEGREAAREAAREADREEAATAAPAAMEPARPEGWLREAAEAGKPTEAGGGAALGKADLAGPF